VSLVIIVVPFDGGSLHLHLLSQTINIEEELRALPAHAEGFARIFDYSYDFDKRHLEQLEERIRNVYPSFSEISCSPTDAALAYDLDSIVSQWDSDVPVWLRALDYSHKTFIALSRHAMRSKYLICLPAETNGLLSE
jgi:hypothetical protein